ncbi:GNAT family N-acetyltransferase [Sphingomonas sp. HF-S3]|uniref:GNAT family N-acetyltransferase n=1 Tax=Sphingomonas rustica TaxID=3103142 RepID=A0ABV0B9R0_9SPHN
MSGSAAWRPMRADDLSAVAAISDAVHGAFTEPAAVYAERLALYPLGCHVLAQENEAAIGYLIGHPWPAGAVLPAIGKPIGAVPEGADGYYLHDLALMPAARGRGAAQAAVARVLAQARAEGARAVMLIAVNGADRFWRTQGFAEVPGDPPYGDGTMTMQLAIDASR